MKLTLLLLLSAVAVFFGLQSGSLTTWDEAVYAQVSREMVQRGNWFCLYYYGSAWMDKPPLYLWIMAFFFKFFGVGEFAARIGAGMLAICTVALTYFLAKRLFGEDAAFFSGLILISTVQFLRYSRMAMLDVPLTFFVTAASFCFWSARSMREAACPASRPAWPAGREQALSNKARMMHNTSLFAVGIIFGLAALTKGIAALYIPMIIFFFALFSGEMKCLTDARLLIGFAAGLALALPWHLYEYAQHGRNFLDGYLFTHLLRRTTQALDQHTGNAFYYVKTVMNKGRPSGIFGIFSLICMLWLALKRPISQVPPTGLVPERYRAGKLSLLTGSWPAGKKEAIFILSWILVVFGICTFTCTKLPWYIIPVYPALSISAGVMTEKILKRRWRIFFLLAATIILTFGIKYRVFDTNLNREVKNLASIARANSSSNRGVYLYRVSDPGVVFYFGDVFKKVEEESDLLGLVSAQEGALFVAGKQDYEAILAKTTNLRVLGTSNYYVLFTR